MPIDLDSPVLAAHRERVARLGDALEHLEAMHDEAYDIWDHIVRLADSDDPERHEKLDALHDAAQALADRIARLREDTFGSISRDASLRLAAQAESVRPGLLAVEPALLPGE